MRVVVQRVQSASVKVNGSICSSIGKGMLLLVGVAKGDTEECAARMAEKIAKLRIFDDARGKMNLDVKETGGEVLSVSQFTLLSDLSKGNRPGFDSAEEPDKAEKLWNSFNKYMEGNGLNVKKGEFASCMAVELINDGPVTFILDSKTRLS